MGDLPGDCAADGELERLGGNYWFHAAVVGAAALNMWMGVSKAGYSFGEELPIFLLIFLLPSLVALAVKWKFL
jgi:hypothetical protein